MRETIWKLCNLLGIINFQNLQAAHAAQYWKNKQPNQKMGRRPKEIFIQRSYTGGQEAHGKVFDIANY